jgi:hypothetical protein
MIGERYTMNAVGDFWEVFDNQEKITIMVTEYREAAISSRNYLNGTVNPTESNDAPIELTEPRGDE